MTRRRCEVTGVHPIDDIAPGDVIAWGRKRTLRKVRDVRRCPCGLHIRAVEFAKLKHSRYDGPTVVYSRTDIRYMYRGTKARGVNLCTTDLECRVQQYAVDYTQPRPSQRATVGVVW